jgi:hypothetical protein
MFASITSKLRPASTVAAALAAAALVAQPIAAQAQATPKADVWQTNLTLYGWFPGFSGQTSYPADTGGSGLNVNAETIIENLKMVFMGTLDVHNGRWGVLNDIVYMDVGNDKANTRDFASVAPACRRASGPPTSASTSRPGSGRSPASGSMASPSYTMDVLAGARMLDLEETLTYSLYGDIAGTGFSGRTGSRDASQTNWDAIIGVKGRWAFGDRREWFVPYYFDVGTGESDLTWQAVVGLGYQFSWGAVSAGYRVLDYNFKSGGKVQDLSASGPEVAFTFRF